MSTTIEAFREINGRISQRYREDRPVTLDLYGYHPEYLVQDEGDEYGFYPYEIGSPNLVGKHSIRTLAFLGASRGETVSNPLVVIDGLYYYCNKMFGIEIAVAALAEIAQEVGFEGTLTSYTS